MFELVEEGDGRPCSDRMTIGTVKNGTGAIFVLDDMREPDATFPEKRVAIEMTETRMGLNRDELVQHIVHCLAALNRF